jgi:hypothetical protein
MYTPASEGGSKHYYHHINPNAELKAKKIISSRFFSQ